MKTKLVAGLALTLLSALNSHLSNAHAQGTAFTMYVANSLAYNSSPTTRYFTVEKFDSQGNASVFATNSSFSNPILSAPEAVAINTSGHVYMDCSQDNTWIEEFDSFGNNPARFVNSTVSYPAGMVFDGSGNLYVANNNSIEVYNPAGQGSVFATTGTAVLEGLAFDATGNLWVSDEYNGLVEMRNTGGTLTTFASPGHNPYGLAFDKSGNLYVALAGNGTIVKYDTNANSSVVATNLGGGNYSPLGLVFDPAGNLYVSIYYKDGGGKIMKIDPQYNVTTFATNGLNGTSFLAIVAAAPTLTITYSGNQAIVSWPPAVTGWTLQTNNNLATGGWGNYLGPVVNNRATNSPSIGNLFFRLSNP
jgi:sugar lactone lactonase YvrE